MTELAAAMAQQLIRPDFSMKGCARDSSISGQRCTGKTTCLRRSHGLYGVTAPFVQQASPERQSMLDGA